LKIKWIFFNPHLPFSERNKLFIFTFC
jgi:hypothetical protein